MSKSPLFNFTLLNLPREFKIGNEEISAIFQQVETHVPKKQNGILNIAFLPDSEIQKLNHTYRNIDQTTDVLSFHYFDDFGAVRDDEVVGEIVLSLSKIIAQAEEHGHSIEIETKTLILHATLHILGYDHENDSDYEEMWKFEAPLRKSLVLI